MQSQQDACFKFTKNSLNNLRNKGIPEEIIQNLGCLEEQKFSREYEVLNIVKRQLGEEQIDIYRDILLKNLQQDDNEDFMPVLFKKKV